MKISKGSDVGGLIRYLMGPGDSDEHTDQQVIGAWSGQDPSSLQPQWVAEGQRFDSRGLIDHLEVNNLVRVGQGSSAAKVWHASLSIPESDGKLSDEQWAHAAKKVTDAVGLNEQGVRWVAVRHGVSSNGNDHVHIAAVLARPDGSAASYNNDYKKAGAAAQALEKEWGLTTTADRDSTARIRPSRTETERTRHDGYTQTSREILQHKVSAAAASTSNAQEFKQVLESQGVIVTLSRESQIRPGTYLGVTFADPGYCNGQGEPIHFSGSKLAPELSMRHLQDRWDEANTIQREQPALANVENPVQSAEEFLQLTQDKLDADDPNARDYLQGARDILTEQAEQNKTRTQPEKPEQAPVEVGPSEEALEDVNRIARHPHRAPYQPHAASGIMHVIAQTLRATQTAHQINNDVTRRTLAAAARWASIHNHHAPSHRLTLEAARIEKQTHEQKRSPVIYDGPPQHNAGRGPSIHR